MNVKLIVFLLLELKLSQGMPQGFFSQGFAIPKISLNKNEHSVTLANVKIKSPSSLFGVFGKKDPVANNELLSSQGESVNIPAHNLGQTVVENKTEKITKTNNNFVIINQEQNPSGSVEKNPELNKRNNFRDDTDLDSKYKAVEANVTENNIDDTDYTTELFTETTTDDYETTTADYDVFNRASPQLVASLLG